MKQDTLFILAVALITWGGVFGYMLRLNFLAKAIDEKLKQHNDNTLE